MNIYSYGSRSEAVVLKSPLLPKARSIVARRLWHAVVCGFLLSVSISLWCRPAGGAEPDGNDTGVPLTLPGSPFGVAWGFSYGDPATKAEVFLPQLRQMGAGCTKVYLFWSQIEPEKGHYDWRAVDAFTKQLKSPEEGLVALFSSSTWATRLANPTLPPSPAKDLGDYYRFVNALVRHCKGHIRYWQNDCEPNNPIYWSGTAEDFVAQLKVFHRAVKDADPKAVVVCGGYDGLFGHPVRMSSPARRRGLPSSTPC